MEGEGKQLLYLYSSPKHCLILSQHTIVLSDKTQGTSIPKPRLNS